MTDPIQPVSDPSTPQSGLSLESLTALFRSPPGEVTEDAAAPNYVPAQAGAGESPLAGQYREPHVAPRHPLLVTFISGRNKGQQIDLGVAVNEHGQDQSASWTDDGAKGIRQGVNFDKVSPRTFDFEVLYHDLTENIIHLVESLAHMQVVEENGQPPFLMITHGQTNIAPVVSTSIKPSYDLPLIGSTGTPESKGFRRCKVSLSFKLVGGKDSEHIFAPPLAPNPLSDRLATITQQEAERQGAQEVARLLLADCLGETGSDAITDLMENDELSTVESVAALPDDALVQGAIAGFFSSDVLNDPIIQERLDQALGGSIAATTNGIPRLEQEAFAEAIRTGSVEALPDRLRVEAQRLQPQFGEILDAIQRQDFEVLQDATNPASNTFVGFGSCGLSLRQAGVGPLTDGNPSAVSADNEAALMQDLSDFFGAEPNDDQVRERFGSFLTDAEVNSLRNGHPYQSKGEFIEFQSQEGVVVSGFGLLSTFDSTKPDPDPLSQN